MVLPCGAPKASRAFLLLAIAVCIYVLRVIGNFPKKEVKDVQKVSLRLQPYENSWAFCHPMELPSKQFSYNLIYTNLNL